MIKLIDDWEVGDSMSENDYKRILAKMSNYINEIPSIPPQESAKLLIDAGIYNKSGKIKRIFNK